MSGAFRAVSYAAAVLIASWISVTVVLAANDCGATSGDCGLEGIGWMLGIGIALIVSLPAVVAVEWWVRHTRR